MDKYFCVFQLPDQQQPMRVSFEEKHPGAAIVKLMQLANVTSTMEFEQAEILKCVRDKTGKPAYMPVFVKEKKDRKGRAILSSDQTPAPVIDTPAVEEQLDVYKRPYTIEVM